MRPGVCTHSLGGMKPSLVVRVVVDGLEKTGVGIVLGGSSCLGLYHNAVASSVGIVGGVVVVVVVVVVAAAAVVALAVVAEFGVHAHGVAGVAGVAERVACLPVKSQVRSAERSAGLREPARNPSAHSGASKIHDLVSPIARNKVVGRACTAHSGL